ncbi:hypothetical protein [Archaeoglobus profundus]|nr:hypothetical protein [Archaeoglobus profundus]
MKCYILTSDLQRDRAKKIAEKLESLGLEIASEIEPYSCVVVASGGTERKILEAVNEPVVVWALPYYNSLPAVLEAYAVKEFRFFYSDIDEKALEKIKIYERVFNAIKRLRGIRLGIVGGVSDWIVTDGNWVRNLLEVVEIGLEDVRVEGEGVERAYSVYNSLREIIERYELDALTIKCFDLLEKDTTACLALHLLNDEIPAGCEGDLEAVFTMIVLRLLTNQPCWMANINRIGRTAVLSHCTVPKSMCEYVKLTTHMESGKGVGIEGVLRKGIVTIARFRGKRALIARGRILRGNLGDETLCRTQVEVETGDLIGFGNHVVLSYGDHVELLKEFCFYTGFEPQIRGPHHRSVAD